MTFKELREQLFLGIKISDKLQFNLIDSLEIDFDELGEVEYGFWLAKEKNPTESFNLNVECLINSYKKMSKCDQKKAYIYTRYNMVDDPILGLGIKTIK